MIYIIIDFKGSDDIKRIYLGMLLMVIGSGFHIYCVEIMKKFMLLSWVIAIATYVLGITMCYKD